MIRVDDPDVDQIKDVERGKNASLQSVATWLDFSFIFFGLLALKDFSCDFEFGGK